MARPFQLFCLAFLCGIGVAAAQQPPGVGEAAPADLFDVFRSVQGKFILEGNCIQLRERVQSLEMPLRGETGTRLFADELDYCRDTRVLTARGNVAFTNPQGRITAERIEFNTTDGTATFYEATGIMTLGPETDRAAFGGQDPDVYFWGTRIEKLGPRKYRITRGGFTACVQPTPRWEVTSNSIDLNLDDYALARSTVLRVKGVPLLYVPALYYPLQEDQRSTGFLMPSYGASSIRGGSLSNAFFWAIGRSQDATFFHDWFTKAGQGAGAEYRYIANASSSGEFQVYRFSQRRTEYTDDGETTVLPQNTSYEVQGSVVHSLGPNIDVRGRAEYASDLVSQQLYQQNIYRASNPIRIIEGGLTGTWGVFSTNALYQRTEVFSSTTQSTIYGSTPRFTGAVAPTRLFGLPLYGSLNSEYANLPYRTVVDGETVSDIGFRRLDFAPSLRVPFSRLTFLTVNTNAAYRTTYYDRSLDAQGRPIDEPVGRTYYSVRSEVIGPVVNKIWDTPQRTTIDRMKHVIEPAVTVDYVADIANARRLPTLSHTTDVIVGGTTSLTYGVTNRFFYRRRPTDAGRGSSQEFLTVGLQQTYYSNPAASRWDFQYAGASSRQELVDLSPIALTARVTPSSAVSANARIEYDVSGLGLQTVSLGGSVGTTTTTANASYSRVVYSPTSMTHTLTLSDSMRFMDGRTTGSYSLSWDLARSYVVSQSLAGTYLAQCCGFTVEYQQYNYPDVVGFPLSADRRINFGFVLAGLGTFSNFFGAFGGQP